MKKLFVSMFAVCIAAAAFAQAQGDHNRAKLDFERIKAEKVAFITSEVGLTSKEAEAFWPIYNKIDAEQRELIKAERKAFKALNEAIKAGTDTKALLDEWINAKNANVNLHMRAVKEYRKVLSEEKVAKFYTCEEKFLRRQLGKLGGGRKGQMKGQFNGRRGQMGAGRMNGRGNWNGNMGGRDGRNGRSGGRDGWNGEDRMRGGSPDSSRRGNAENI